MPAAQCVANHACLAMCAVAWRVDEHGQADVFAADLVSPDGRFGVTRSKWNPQRSLRRIASEQADDLSVNEVDALTGGNLG
jgi:hypothetical protein